MESDSSVEKQKDKTGAIELDVSMDMATLSKFMLRNNFLRMSGIIGLLISIGAICLVIFYWGRLDSIQRMMLILLGALFTVIQPVLLLLKESKRLKTGVYSEKFHFSIYKDGIDILSVEGGVSIKWDQIYKLVVGKNAIYIYMNALLAFIINRKSCGDKYEETVKYLKEHVK